MQYHILNLNIKAGNILMGEVYMKMVQFTIMTNKNHLQFVAEWYEILDPLLLCQCERETAT